MEDLTNFDESFKALTGKAPFRWQRRLFRKLRSGEPFRYVNLPTGLGKTSIIPIWLIALGESASPDAATSHVPRRLVYIVNRRTVVDQATHVTEQMRERLLHPDNDQWKVHSTTLKSILHRLSGLAVSNEVPVAISTLRGELADNEEWKADPARPAIIIGTVDMIGSKLLFSGYGDSYRMRPHHAGLIGQDTLIVLDEAHLTPAFGNLLRQVAEAQKETHWLPHTRVVELSATPSTTSESEVLTLEPEDEKDPVVQDRLNAHKSLYLHEIDSEKLHETIVDYAFKHENAPSKVLIYVRSPQDAGKILTELQKRMGRRDTNRTALLTGTMRGHERDRLVRENPIYHAFLNHGSSVESTLYLVSTSAGEVGIDLDADHIVCDLTFLKAMVQRLGRVNRCGRKSSRIDVLLAKEDKETKKKVNGFDNAAEQTGQMLRRLGKQEDQDDGAYDASPKSLQGLLQSMTEEEKRQASIPEPSMMPITDILVDLWSLTSVRERIPARPEIAPYLHGLTNAPPESYVIWRKETALLGKYKLDADSIEDWFSACRIEAQEKLRDRTDRIFSQLKRMNNRLKGKAFPLVLLDEYGRAEIRTLDDVIRRDKDRLAYRTLILPVEAGGLTNEGMLDGGSAFSSAASDIAEYEGKRLRLLLNYRDETCRVQKLDTLEDAEIDVDSETVMQLECGSPQEAGLQLGRRHDMVVSRLIPLREQPDGGEDEIEARYLLLLVEPRNKSLDNVEAVGYRGQPTLQQHTEQVVSHVTRITESLNLPNDICKAVAIAAKWHDVGKKRRIWQQAIYNTGEQPLAKPGRRGMNVRLLGGFRHEFGSVLEAAADPEVQVHPEQEQDLILHLIATHHGHGRPHFKFDAFDIERTTDENEKAAHEVMRRFARLQQRFGHWGLAWLESLLRCADTAASQETTEQRSMEVRE